MIMQRLTWHFGNRGPSWLFDLLFGPAAGLLTNRWWHLAALTIGCFSGCSSLQEAQEAVAQPFQATREWAARASDQIADSLGFDRPLDLRVPGSRSWRSDDPRTAPNPRLASKGPSDQYARARSLATPNSRAIASDNNTLKVFRPEDAEAANAGSPADATQSLIAWLQDADDAQAKVRTAAHNALHRITEPLARVG